MKRPAILTALTLVLGCGIIEDPTPEQARLIVTGDAETPVRLIVSTKFVAQVNEIGQTRVVIFESDTLVTTLPYETLHAINQDQRFFVEAARLDADLQNVQVQVFVDERKLFDEGGALLADQPYRFVYTFNQRVTRDIVVL